MAVSETPKKDDRVDARKSTKPKAKGKVSKTGKGSQKGKEKDKGKGKGKAKNKKKLAKGKGKGKGKKNNKGAKKSKTPKAPFIEISTCLHFWFYLLLQRCLCQVDVGMTKEALVKTLHAVRSLCKKPDVYNEVFPC